MFRAFRNSQTGTRWQQSVELVSEAPKLFCNPTEISPRDITFEHSEPLALFRLRSYRFSTPESIIPIFKTLCESAGDDFAVILKSEDSAVNILFAVEDSVKARFLNTVKSSLPSSDIISESPGKLFSYSSNMVITGDFDGGTIDWDSFCRFIKGTDSLVCMHLKKIRQDQINRQVDEFEKVRANLTEYRKFTVTNGSKTVERVNSDLSFAFDQIEAYSQRLNIKNANGKLFEMTLIVSAENENTAHSISSSLISVFHSDADSDRRFCRPLESIVINNGPISKNVVVHPVSNKPVQGFSLYKNRYSSVLSSAELSCLLPIPQDEHSGFYVDISSRKADSYNEFDIKPHNTETKDRVKIGVILESGEAEYISLADLKQHTLVSGASGTGKSTSLFRLIKAASDVGVKCLMLEPVKGEFQALPSYGVDAEIFSSSHSGRMLKFNPLIPQELTSIRDHCSGIVEAITSHSDNESPIPEALSMLLMHCYELHGWLPEDVYFKSDEKTFPGFSEVYNEILPYFSSLNLYAGEVRTNIRSALTVRLNAIKNFPFVQGDKMLNIKELLSTNSVIQFDGLNRIADKCFFGNLILLNLNEYIRSDDYSQELKNLIVIDEAHNFFERKKSDTQTSRTQAGENLSNMISELRGYGTGFVVCDQRPSAISQTVISNTATKICHACEYHEDISELSQSLGLSEYQSGLFHSLAPGEAIVSIRGNRSVAKVKIEQLPVVKTHMIGMCRFCPNRNRCNTDEICKALEHIPTEYYAGVFLRSISNKEKLMFVCKELSKECGTNNTNEILCLSGHIVELVEGVKFREYLNSQIYNILSERRINHG